MKHNIIHTRIGARRPDSVAMLSDGTNTASYTARVNFQEGVTPFADGVGFLMRRIYAIPQVGDTMTMLRVELSEAITYTIAEVHQNTDTLVNETGAPHYIITLGPVAGTEPVVPVEPEPEPEPEPERPDE